MKKRTSKSASATRRTSSRSGTSNPTADTAKAVEPKFDVTSHPLYLIVEKIKNMTPEEFHQSLVRAGIENEDGTLRPEYTRRK
jgi:hypothetical protein